MQSSDPRHFFETDAEQLKRSLRAAKATNKFGSPIPLKSKILAATPDPLSLSTSLLVAESTGSVRRVSLSYFLGKPPSTSQTYRGPTTPISALTTTPTTLFAGAWDKTIWSWDLTTRTPGQKYTGHSDFVKALACTRIGDVDILISGGADKKIIVWDVATGKKLHVMTDAVVAMGSVQGLVVDSMGGKEGEEVVVVSASSDPHIRRWRVRMNGWEQEVIGEGEEEKRVIAEHETTVYKVVVDEEGEGDIWSASGDGMVKCLARGKGWAVEETLEHGGHVRAVAVTERWVVTAGRDEDVKFWDRAEGRLYCALQGHFDEVTELVVVGDKVVSVSIDGTVRSWPLDKAALDEAVEEQKPKVEEEEEKGPEKGSGLLSADEEAELAALMEED
ncbi:WD40-repeat-containing domain protein [Podospora aff. communis PSN243]|uniref:WD40-repeat-containing domain protein n=1 Tax=Podospora aff. communis PSN243 TaxID=3040156 RepID=A0AAV9H3K0_9PEZI|nr:WD40-repeat-containing domain protein [Podospora aff. communis PSN243]